MIVKSLELKDYRNYNNLNVQFHSGTNILYGENAQGKTNILEAIYLCGTTKSHRGSKDKEVIMFEKEESHIRVQLDKNNIEHRIDLHLKKNKAKGVAIDGHPIKKQGELFGMLNLVFFSPEDLYIIKNGPSERRRFLDLELCQLDKIYLNNLSNYNKVLQQRNNLLKQIGFNRNLLETLYIWDAKLIEYGKKIIVSRFDFIDKLNSIVGDIHKKLTGGKEELKLQYEPNVEVHIFEDKLKKSLERDLALKMTNVGPHRDDFNFLVGTIDIRKYGSQGQQRTAALSCKLAEIDLVKSIIKDNPILLLDDVLSELDRQRQTYLLNSIGEIQTIITCTGLEEFINHRFQYNKIFHVEEGNVTEKNQL
ncbi:DNA replication/repair protein RecF [Lachnospiraceae bacterium MD1]|jgi:DNA replication and repair protein RecF|uniref:DNA replication and repair protein RecF n=1 Tax=Variimorphobacter saccharofermentans TaxID=2755051 RepID=A0A839K4D4_9FIRM|nr:DNA replication/repair protein RecF [Variimorphobacter saccharofermentans]MBB2184734.1 DNA replication/repair protein RecF [Variimorphobacter saccharofermentans]